MGEILIPFFSKAITMFTDDPEEVIAAFSGAISDSVLHPKLFKKLLIHLAKAAVVGFFLAEFISPVISEQFNLTRKQSNALSFICGFAGITILRHTEKLIEKKIQLMGGIEGISTLSSKPSEEEGASEESDKSA